MQVVPLQCPLCTGLIQIDRALAGQQVACPLCQQTIQLPPAEFFTAPPASPVPPELPPAMPADLVHLACPVCAGVLAVPAAISGQEVACPHCASPILIGPVAPSPREFSAAEPRQPDPAPAVSPRSSGNPATTASPGNERLPPTSPPSDRLPPREFVAPPADRLPPAKSTPLAPRADRLPPGDSGTAKTPSERLPPSRSPEPASQKRAAVAPDEAVANRESRSPTTTMPAAPAAAVSEPVEEAPAADGPDLAALLPPGAEDWRPTDDEPSAPVASKRSKRSIEELLPPGADGSVGAMPGEQVEVPDAPRRRPAIAVNLPKGTVAVPTPDGGFVTVTESPTVIGEGDEEIEVRRLTPEEKARRRFRRNLILWSLSILILLVVTWWLVG